MRNNSTVRVRIVVHDPWLARLRTEGRDLLATLRAGMVGMKQLLCGLRGHRYELKVQQRRLSLHCRACGHGTVGWDLSDRTPRLSGTPERPRYLELLRKRG